MATSKEIAHAAIETAAAGLAKASVNMLNYVGKGGTARPINTPPHPPERLPEQRSDRQRVSMAHALMPWLNPDVPFGPNKPLVSSPINHDGPEGYVEPRTWQYPVSWNLQVTVQKQVPFTLLRQAADVDFVRRCIEIRKSDIVSLTWDIGFKDHALQQVMAEGSATSKGKATQVLRDKYAEELVVYRKFWERPNRRNHETFSVWLGKLLEEYLVLDALTIYPARTWGSVPVIPGMGADVHSLRILDGSTIKPLLDELGDIPQPPNVAYQQILHGFPRGDYTASDPDSVNMELRASDLIYSPRNRRSNSPFGLSAVEQCLPFIDLWLKREEWLRSEFADGATPDTWLMPKGIAETWTPSQRLAYENAINNDLSGQTAERHRLKLLPPGLEPQEMQQAVDKFSGNYDAWLISSLASFFDVLPTQLGIQPRKGASGAHQEGEQEKSEAQARRPTIEWLVDLLNEISVRYLGMPEQFTFRFYSTDEVDIKEVAEGRAKAVTTGQTTINDLQADQGLPLYDFPEADEPMIIAGNTVNFINGLMDQQQKQADAAMAIAEAKLAEPAASADNNPADRGTPGNPGKQDETTPPRKEGGDTAQPTKPKTSNDSQSRADIGKEASAFSRFADKRASGRAWRDFEFVHIDATTAAELNSLGQTGKFDELKSAIADLTKES